MICAACRASLPEPHSRGEQLCVRCAAQRKPPRRVYMSFQSHSSWICQFLEEDLRTPLPRKLSLLSIDRLFEIAERGRRDLTTEDRQALQHGIEIGRGGVWLELTEEQYRKLKGNQP